MPNAKRPKIQEETIRTGGGNIHLREPNKPSEQVRITKKVSHKLRGM
jgi:hypothetical protein